MSYKKINLSVYNEEEKLLFFALNKVNYIDFMKLNEMFMSFYHNLKNNGLEPIKTYIVLTVNFKKYRVKCSVAYYMFEYLKPFKEKI